MKTRKWLGIVLAVLLVASLAIMATACTNIFEDSELITVTWYDGRTPLRTDEVEKGSKLENWTPEKEDYVFTGWYEEASLTNEFDFDKTIEEDTNIFSRWRSANVEADNRIWYIIGSMGESNWKFVGEKDDNGDWQIADGFDQLVFQHTDDPNKLELTIELRPGVKFRFVTNLIGSDWSGDETTAQVGLGNLTGFEYAAGTNPEKNAVVTAESKEYGVVKDKDGKVVFEGGFEYNMPTNQWNIWPVAGSDGIYKFTLTTYPGDDLNDTMEWECIKKLEPLDETFDMYITGTLGSGEDWKDDYASAVKLTRDSNDQHLWVGYIHVTEADYASWAADEGPFGEPCASFKVKNNILKSDHGVEAVENVSTNKSGTAGSGNIFVKAGDYCVTYSETDNVICFEELGYYLVGTFMNGDEAVNFVVKNGFSTEFAKEGEDLVASINVTDVSAEETYGWLVSQNPGKGYIFAMKAVYGCSLAIKTWYGVGEKNGDNYFFTEEGEYTVTLYPTAGTFEVAKKGEDPIEKNTVTYYGNGKVLKTERVEDGGHATYWEPEVDGYDFGGWYTTDALDVEFNFDTTEITEDISIYAKLTEQEKPPIPADQLDQRSYFLCGNGAGDIGASNWNSVAATTFKREPGTNTYKLENFKIMPKDEMKLRFNTTSWNSGSTQYAFGAYFFAKENEAIFGKQTAWDANAKVKDGVSGIYNIILETSGRNTATTGAAEKQIVSFRFEFVQSLEVTTEDMGCYLTGTIVTPNWTTNPNHLPTWKMTQISNPDVWEYTHLFTANKKFKALRITKVVENGEPKYTPEWANNYTGPNSDTDGNYVVPKTGYYKVSYNTRTKTMTVEFLGTEDPNASAAA